MQTRMVLRWPAVLLAAAVLSIPVFDANARSGNQFGPAVDTACLASNGTRPFNDNSCALCHNTSSLGQRQEPSWTWWEDGNLTNFCPPTSNTAPVATNDSSSTNEDVAVTIAVLNNDSDADGDALSVSSVTQGANGSVTNNGGNVRYTPNADFNGSDSFNYTANDGTASSNVATVSVTVNAVNDQPMATNPGNQTSVEGQSVSLQIAAADPDTGETLSYSASGLPTGLAIAAGSGLINGTPAAGSSANSPYTVTVTVEDSGNPTGTDSVTFSWTVSATNAAPTITSTPITTATEAQPYAYQVAAEDEGTLTYSLGTAPSGMTVSASGLIQWTPGDSQVGTNIVTVTVTDDAGLTASQSFTIEVQAGSGPPQPVACTDADGDGFSPDGGICGPVDSNDDNPAINPGRVEVCDDGIDNDSDGDTDASDSECNGSNCLAGLFGVVNITTAVWDAAASELQVRGTRCTSGSPIALRNADSGALLDNAVVDNIGAWSFSTAIDDVAAVPCRVRVEVDGNSGESDVANAPVNCNDDSGGGAAPNITKAEWNAEKERLRVEGDGAEGGQTVTVYSATTDASLGTTTVGTDGRWRFESFNLTPVPCAVRVEIGGSAAERDLKNAPANCASDPAPPPADFSIDRADWNGSDRKLLVSGRDGPGGQGRATLLSADGSVVLGRTKVEDDGKWKFEVEKPRMVPCQVRVEIGSSTAVRAVSNAPANCFQ